MQFLMKIFYLFLNYKINLCMLNWLAEKYREGFIFLPKTATRNCQKTCKFSKPNYCKLKEPTQSGGFYNSMLTANVVNLSLSCERDAMGCFVLAECQQSH